MSSTAPQPAIATRRPFIVGAPRSGFSLMTAIVGSLAPGAGRLAGQPALTLLENAVKNAIQQSAEAHYSPERVLFNPNFQELFGGPKYIDNGATGFRVRKYLGIINRGDIIINITLPFPLLNYVPLIHFHHICPVFLDRMSESILPIQTIRNPAGIINSSCFSLNVLTSEFIQRTNITLHQQDIRTEIGFRKMTSPEVFSSLCRFYSQNYANYYLKIPEHTVRWEDTIDRSVEVVFLVARYLGTGHSREACAKIWQGLDHRNLTNFHMHNFREGYGIVGDWKNWLVPQHLEIMKETGIDRLFEVLGYPFPSPEDVAPKTSWQRKCAYMIEKGLAYTPSLESDLVKFSENKSNAAVDRPTFRGNSISIEDCGLGNDEMINEIITKLDEVLARVRME